LTGREASGEDGLRISVPRTLAEIVLEEGLATASSVLRAAEVADRDGIPLVVALVRECAIDEVAMVAALRRHVRVALADPATVASEPDAVRELARDVCQRLRVVPLAVSSYDGRRRLLRLAVADPTDAVAMAEIEHHTGCQLEPVLMTLSAIEELVDKAYRHFVTEVMPRDSKRQLAAAVAAFKAREAFGTVSDETTPAPATVPYHRLSDEAELEIRLRAVMNLLLEKQVFTEDELEEMVRQLMRQRDSSG
jgi:hypothetical protein